MINVVVFLSSYKLHLFVPPAIPVQHFINGLARVLSQLAARVAHRQEGGNFHVVWYTDLLFEFIFKKEVRGGENRTNSIRASG